MQAQIMIQHGGRGFLPAVREGAVLTLERCGMPGKLEFTAVQADGMEIAEGDQVKLTVDGQTMFYGFLFTKKQRAGSPEIEAVAYDQLRYLKNKDTFIAEGITASGMVRRLAEDFKLSLGEIGDTGYVFEAVVEENQTLLDMIQNALDETLAQTGQMFVLYDEGGFLTLRNTNDMRLNLLIDAESGESFDYESSIDKNTYNQVKLAYLNDRIGKQESYLAKDAQKISEWGVLQYFEPVKSMVGAAEKAQALLKLYDQKTRRLTIRNAFGDTRVRAGSTVMVSLELQDMQWNSYLMVEKVAHRFGGGVHLMDLSLVGGGFIA